MYYFNMECFLIWGQELRIPSEKNNMNFIQICWVWDILTLSTEGRVEVECMDVEMRNLDWQWGKHWERFIYSDTYLGNESVSFLNWVCINLIISETDFYKMFAYL